MIHAVSKLGVPAKSVDKKDTTALLKRARHPNRKTDADNEITEVASCNIYKNISRSSYLNAFKNGDTGKLQRVALI